MDGAAVVISAKRATLSWHELNIKIREQMSANEIKWKEDEVDLQHQPKRKESGGHYNSRLLLHMWMSTLQSVVVVVGVDESIVEQQE